MRHRVTLLVALLLAGCAQAPGDAPPATPGAPAVWSAIALEGCAAGCWEPMVAVDPEGRIFVVAGTEDKMSISTDGGASFVPLDLPPMPPGAPTGARRVDQTIATDPSGVLYFAAFLAPPTPGIPPPLGLQVATSADAGRSWASNVLLSIASDPDSGVVSPFKMWLAFAADGAAYLDFNQRPGGGVWLGRSDDQGRTWTPFVRVQPPEDRIFSVFFSPPVVDAQGRVLIAYFGNQHPNPGANPFYFQGEELRLAISEDRGATFRHVVIASAAAPDAVGTAFPSLAMDASGGLHVAYWDNERTRVSSSLDGGGSWSTPIVWGDRETVVGPWAAARGGDLSVIHWDAASGDLVLHEGTPSGGPTRVVVLAKETGVTGDFPHFALDREGRVAAVVGAGDGREVRLVLAR